jgi:ATP-binding cassette, subfamily B, bacterial PglK
MKTLKKYFYLLSPKERKQAYLLLGMILVMALLDMLGVASIMPFISVLSNPELIQTNNILNNAFKFAGKFGITTNQQFLFTSGVFVFLLLIFSITFKALTNYVQIRFICMREYSLGKRLMEGYLHHPYSWFLNRHSASLSKTVISDVGTVIAKGLNPIMSLIAQSFVTLSLITLLIIVDPKLTLLVGLTLGCAYGLIYKLTRGYITRIGKESIKANLWRFTTIGEAFGATKEIKVGGLEQVYIKRFSDPAKIIARNSTSSNIVSQLPRYALEGITFGGMILVVLYLMSKSGTFIEAIPIIALFAFAGYRLMPSLQLIYSNSMLLRYSSPSLDTIIDDLKTFEVSSKDDNKETLKLKKNITLKKINYHYPGSSQTVLKDINLSIDANSTVGLVGATGSGKTTLVDIILGLLEAQQGTLQVDGQTINKNNSRAWQKSIGYVPQEIFLTDDTVAANIALGIEQNDINQEAVERASKIANLHNFVIDKLPLKYGTTVGERGVRLSGGQRQRIGIARALYHNPQVLILDEATSALDNLTEQAVMEAVHNLKKNITIILIAHRLTTVKKCDEIFFLEKGELKAQGTFEKLRQISDNFRANAEN